jgi:hypothetical protein
VCGAEIQFPFECAHCGEVFCSKHKFPENHECHFARNTFNKDSWRQPNEPAESKDFKKTGTTESDPRIFEKPKLKMRSRKLKIALFTCFLIALIVGSFLAGTTFNNSAESKENSNQYSAGYSAGLLAGQSQGYSSAYTEGKTASQSQGYTEGFTEGIQSGYNQGYQQWLIDQPESVHIPIDPTCAEMKRFMQSDETDLNNYTDPMYVCYDFASGVCRHTAAIGYRCGFVYIRLADTQSNFSNGIVDSTHAMVCFNATDKGLIFIEPQTDEEIPLSVGKSLDSSNATISYWLRRRYGYGLYPSSQDIVVSFDIIW